MSNDPFPFIIYAITVSIHARESFFEGEVPHILTHMYKNIMKHQFDNNYICMAGSNFSSSMCTYMCDPKKSLHWPKYYAIYYQKIYNFCPIFMTLLQNDQTFKIVILTKCHKNSTKIVDFLLIANFGLCKL